MQEERGGEDKNQILNGEQGEYKSLDELLKRLEEIVLELEKAGLPIERAVELFEEGIKISKIVEKKLKEVERKIELLLQDGSVVEVKETELEKLKDKV